MANPLDELHFESPFLDLGEGFYDPVEPGQFKRPRVRFSNSALFEELGIDPAKLEDAHLIESFGEFRPLKNGKHPPLAQRYIGYQFRNFNPHLGDGRGFTLAQLRGRSGTLWDWGTKGSGTTPWSRGGDGRLTLKGGVREIIASEFLQAMGVKASRCLVLLEHDEALFRGDEPSPTRASILVRMGEGHIRFGSFERIYYLERDRDVQRERMQRLLDHVVETYYPHFVDLKGEDRVLALYGELLDRTATVVAMWVKSGFCHGVLNTDNMSMTGDSFDYGPFAFMEKYDPLFTAAYFDHTGLYAYERQPEACAWNLAMLMRPLSVLASEDQLNQLYESFGDRYRLAFAKAMLPRLGFEYGGSDEDKTLLMATLEVLRGLRPSYHGFFMALTDRVKCFGPKEGEPQLPRSLFEALDPKKQGILNAFTKAWQRRFSEGDEGLDEVVNRLCANNPRHIPYRHEIERVWASIDKHDDWEPLYDLVKSLQSPFEPA